MLIVADNCGDDLSLEAGLDRHKISSAVKQAGFTILPKKFLDAMLGEDALGEIEPHIEAIPYHGWLFNRRLYIGAAIVYHYRNDDTRHLWGPESPLEQDLPSERRQMSRLLTHAAYANAKNAEAGVIMFCEAHQYDQGDGTSTDDRHHLVFLFDFENLCATKEANRDSIFRLLKELVRT